MNLRESKRLEFKSAISDSFLKTVSAFANYGTGEIIFGISDKGHIMGLANPIESCLIIENKINDCIKPVPQYNLDVNSKNNTVTLKVFEGLDKPYTYKNKAYKRNDSSTIEVEKIEYNRLILEGQNLDYDEIPSKKQNLHFKELEKQLIDKLQISSISKDILKTLELFNDKTGFNIAAELLADANSFSGIDIVRFGTDIDIFLDRLTLEKISVLKMYNSALEFYKRYYQYEKIIKSKRVTIETIPEVAYREAIINAVVHRTWDVSASIKISMFSDRIEICSPGGLPAGLSKEEYLNGKFSLLRNKTLGNVLLRLGYIEKFGTSINRIKKAYSNSPNKPKFEILDNSISITLPIITINSNLRAVEEKVFNLFLTNRLFSRGEIEKETSLNKDKLIRILNKLIQLGRISKIGKGKDTKYGLIK